MLMIYIERKRKDIYLNLLTNIDKYDIIYIVDNNRSNGEVFELDDYNIYYINPQQEVRYEIAFELLQHDIFDEKVEKVAIINTHNMRITEIRDFKELPIEVDFYGLWSDSHHNIYSSSKYLHSKNNK